MQFACILYNIYALSRSNLHPDNPDMVPMRTLAVALFVLGAECFAPRDLFRVLHKPRSASAPTVSMKMKISRGDVLTGRVTAVKPFGAFVEVGGTSGLLHISQISADFVEDLSQTLTVGMSIKCMIMDDKRKGRVSLSIKTLEPEPGDMLVDPQVRSFETSALRPF